MSGKNNPRRSRARAHLTAFLEGEKETLFALPPESTERDIPREETVGEERAREETLASREAPPADYARTRAYKWLYPLSAVICCASLIGLLLLTVARLPEFGEDYPPADEVSDRYLEQGLAETGATNMVAGMILDYRAFDTLGESFVLFTALNCVLILLRPGKNEREEQLPAFDLRSDRILRGSASLLVPLVMVFGFAVMCNGHLSPGGGFAGGAIMGAGLILLSASYGFEVADRFFTRRFFEGVAGGALGFYCLSKAYAFFCGANGLDSHIPKGKPGAIFSGGLILPLNIAVGMVVTLTMFGIYSAFHRTRIGPAQK